MKLLLETALLLLTFLLLIWLFTRKNRLGGIHWYPKAVQQKAVERGLTTRNDIRRGKRLTSLIGLAVIALIVLISVFVANGARDWQTAACQLYGMLFALNLFDAVVVDYLWVRKTSYWYLPELADLEIAKPIDYLIKERIIAALIYLPLAALFACVTFLLD